MSSAAVLRLRERGGGGGGGVRGGGIGGRVGAKPGKEAETGCEKVVGVGDGLKRLISGKENPRSGSRVGAATSQKPSMRPMARVDKQAGAVIGDAEVRAKRPSSVPRGRSTSPFMNGGFSELGKIRGARVSEKGVDELGCGGRLSSGFRSTERVYRCRSVKESSLKVNERTGNETRVVSGDGKGARFDLNSVKNSGGVDSRLTRKENSAEEDKLQLSNAKLSCFGDSSGAESGKASRRPSGSSGSLSSVREMDGSGERSGSALRSRSTVGKAREGAGLLVKDVVEKGSSESKVSSGLKERRNSEEGSSSRGSAKYPSKLHEKLAFLEGKVKRIATDIKRTKEMLDSNNSDESKVILSDIQEKISGIEKAMSCVASGSGEKLYNSKCGNLQTELVEASKRNQGENVSLKVLNREELEARLFPHDRLLRDRTMLKSSSASSKSDSLVAQADGSEDLCQADLHNSAFKLLELVNLENSQSKVLRNENVKIELSAVQEMDGVGTSKVHGSVDISGKRDTDVVLTTTETLDELDVREHDQTMVSDDFEDMSMYQLNEIGRKTSTGGWFISEGESVLLAHDDASCSLYDVANAEEKSVYKPPSGISTNLWRDCWVVRAPDADGCSGRYIVAASAGNAMDSGFCSWDYYTKDIQAFHVDNGVTSTRRVLGPLPNNTSLPRSLSTASHPSENVQWWYKPCGPLIVATACFKQVVKIFDIRDGEQIMDWEVTKPILSMENSSPVQWRNREKVVLAEADNISVWDVSSQKSQPLLYISSAGRKISALHVVNTDAEIGGGVRQRVTSSEAEGNDGVFCTTDFINILDFRHATGVGLKIPKAGLNSHSVFSRGDSVYMGCSNGRTPSGKKQSSQIQHFSMRMEKLVASYELPESNAHPHYTAIRQVWGNSNLVMGICGLGLYVFDALSGDAINTQRVKEVIGPSDMYAPSFDYLSSRALVISRDRPAMCQLVL